MKYNTPSQQQVATGADFTVGTTSVTAEASDSATPPNKATCTFNVTVVDNTPPTIITCAPAQAALVEANCQAQVPDLRSGVVATDNCTANDSLVIAQSPVPGTWVGLGVTLITLTATDASLNQSQPCVTTCAVTAATTTSVAVTGGQYSDWVTFQATVGPVIACPNPGTVQFWVNGNSAGSAPVDSSGVATLNYLIGLPQGLYTIHAQFTSNHPEWFAGSTGDNTLTLTRENAKVTPRPSNPLAVKVNSAGGLTSSA